MATICTNLNDQITGLRVVGGLDLCVAPRQMEWLWHGFVAKGNVTLLTSQWKTGKTTLLAHLLRQMKAGGALAGRAVSQSTALVLTEEAEDVWGLRTYEAPLENFQFICQPYAHGARCEDWSATLDVAARLCRERGHSVFAVDAIANFLPGAGDGNAERLMQLLMPLRALTKMNLAVLLLHHPKKGAQAAGQAARGSGALPSFCDINIEMSWYRAKEPGDRRRRLLSFSRYEETPRDLVIELCCDGSGYVVCEGLTGDDFFANWVVLQILFEEAQNPRTRRQLVDQWPADFPKPHEATLYRWLERACDLKRLRRSGSGKRGDPLRYWLPGREVLWANDPLAKLEERGGACP